MPIYFGDIHNHCNISYGLGSLENALLHAREQLDFVAVTGHAMWPDIYERNADTRFLVDFHERGFLHLRENWERIRGVVGAANSADLVTFQSYELHSCRYGDHHIVSPSDALPLIYRDSPGALVRDCGVEALSVAHHIAYPPGYRGIDWDLYDERTTPLIEVFSKHGCALSETAPYPYYHRMGPRDGRNSVYAGLEKGFRFGLVGSTDHHAGYPGSYGDGRLAVCAPNKSREAIFEALRRRRSYCVSGDKILCELEIDGLCFGDVGQNNGRKRHIRFSVVGDYWLDRVILFKNLKPLKIIDGWLLPRDVDCGRYKFRVEMGWGKSAELFAWEGVCALDGARFVQCQPCFRGRSVLAPSETDAADNATVNQIHNRLERISEREFRWHCESVTNLSGLHPMTNAVIFELEGKANALVSLELNGCQHSFTVADLCRSGYADELEAYNSPAYKIHPMATAPEYSLSCELTDEIETAKDFYHLEVYQKNGQFALVTPIYFEE